MGKTREEIVDEYLSAVAVIYDVGGRYRHCLRGDRLKQEFIDKYPGFENIITLSFRIVKERIDEGGERWPNGSQIKGLKSLIMKEFSTQYQSTL